jgi:hypothetical protein
MTVVRRGLLPSRSASRPDSADLESGRLARVRSTWQRAKGWGGGAGRTKTSGDDHADHDAGQQRTAISHHEPVPRSVPRPPIVQFPLRLSPHDPALHRSRVHRGLGKLHQRSGAPQDAKRERPMARDLYRDMGMTFWLERTESESA